MGRATDPNPTENVLDRAGERRVVKDRVLAKREAREGVERWTPCATAGRHERDDSKRVTLVGARSPTCRKADRSGSAIVTLIVGKKTDCSYCRVVETNNDGREGQEDARSRREVVSSGC